jgi:hypothetical protein
MKTSNMKRTAGVLALLVLFGGAEAIAQSGMNKGSLSTGQTINGGIPDAPIGHRQPRASDVPSEKNLSNPSNPSDPMNKEDAALDKKIKSICRGC